MFRNNYIHETKCQNGETISISIGAGIPLGEVYDVLTKAKTYVLDQMALHEQKENERIKKESETQPESKEEPKEVDEQK